MASDNKFTTFTCRDTASALGLVLLPAGERRQFRNTNPSDATSGKKTVQAGRAVAKFRSRKGCRWLAECGRGFEITAATAAPAHRK